VTDSDRSFIATASQTVGPFFDVGPGREAHLRPVVWAGQSGDRLHLQLRVTDGDGDPVPDALIEIWQADSNGAHGASSRDRDSGWQGIGRLATSPLGTCIFDTVRPGSVASSEAGHVNVCFFSRGLLRHIYTRIYFAGDPALASDPVLALVPPDRRETLIAQPVSGQSGWWSFEIRLQGDRETVFFDL
jgi:protocatechuate 3,4-dioxygenase alpha subunit